MQFLSKQMSFVSNNYYCGVDIIYSSNKHEFISWTKLVHKWRCLEYNFKYFIFSAPHYYLIDSIYSLFGMSNIWSKWANKYY